MPQPELVSPEELERDLEDMWDAEEDLVDRSIQILPSVRRMIDSIPEGRYCVATSGAKTYGKLTLESAILTLDDILILLRLLFSFSSRRNDARRDRPTTCHYHRRRPTP